MCTISRRNKLFSYFILLFFSLPTFSTNGHNYFGLSLGISNGKPSNSTPSISYDSGAIITDDYPLNKTHTSSLMIGMSGGYETTGVNTKPAIAIGVGFYTTPAGYNFDGQLIETAEGDLSSALYNYTYNVLSTRLMAEIQFTWTLKNKLLPYINFGVGPAWNRMNSYKEIAITNNGYVALPPFQSLTETNLAYQAGFGVGTAFNHPNSKSDFLRERISVGYRYTNLGNTSFKIRDLVYPYQLNTGKLQSNEVYFSFTHLI